MRIASLVIMVSAVFIVGCGESKLDEIEERTLKLLEENPNLANDQIKDLDIEYQGEDARGDKYSGLLEIERKGETVFLALDITVTDITVDNVIVDGEPVVAKSLSISMKEVDE